MLMLDNCFLGPQCWRFFAVWVSDSLVIGTRVSMEVRINGLFHPK